MTSGAGRASAPGQKQGREPVGHPERGPEPGPERPIRVLFICTGNSARSQMAEALLRRLGGPAFEAFSAGTEPKGVHPLTLRVLGAAGIDTGGARSKSVTEFVEQSFDYVVTVCDQARESCPVFPGARVSLHWGFEDPAAATGTEEERLAVFERVLGEIAERVRAFVPDALRERELADRRVGWPADQLAG